MIYNKYKLSLLNPLLTANVKAAILGETYVPNQAHEFFSDVSAHQIVITGYTAGGLLLANKVLSESGGICKFTADNPSWDIVGTANVKHVVFYTDSGVPGTSRLHAIYTFPVLRTVINATLRIEIPSTGILSLQ